MNFEKIQQLLEELDKDFGSKGSPKGAMIIKISKKPHGKNRPLPEDYCEEDMEEEYMGEDMEEDMSEYEGEDTEEYMSEKGTKEDSSAKKKREKVPTLKKVEIDDETLAKLFKAFGGRK